MHPFLQSALGGMVIGLASWLLLRSLGRVAGISGIVAGVLVPSVAAERAWRLAFLAGLIVTGGLMLAWLPVAAFAPRPIWLLLGAGFLVGYGTVLGSGCTSGHGVCGLGRRSVRSLAATGTFMGVGMLVASLMAGRA